MASTDAQTSLSAQSTVQNGSTVDFTTAKGRVTAVLVRSSTITDGLIHIQASHDGTNWVIAASLDPSISGNQFWSAVSGAFRYWRGSISRPVVGGGTVSVTFMEAD
jgi:hypothetical protein